MRLLMPRWSLQMNKQPPSYTLAGAWLLIQSMLRLKLINFNKSGPRPQLQQQEYNIAIYPDD